MDICLQRPIIMTCSQLDQTIRVWNYVTNKCELAVNFTQIDSTTKKITQEPLTCAALHPSGYFLAVGLQDNLKMYHIMHEGGDEEHHESQALRQFHTFD